MRPPPPAAVFLFVYSATGLVTALPACQLPGQASAGRRATNGTGPLAGVSTPNFRAGIFRGLYPLSNASAASGGGFLFRLFGDRAGDGAAGLSATGPSERGAARDQRHRAPSGCVDSQFSSWDFPWSLSFVECVRRLRRRFSFSFIRRPGW